MLIEIAHLIWHPLLAVGFALVVGVGCGKKGGKTQATPAENVTFAVGAPGPAPETGQEVQEEAVNSASSAPIDSGTAPVDPTPRSFGKDDKQKAIDQGLFVKKTAYPTLEDIDSDWSDKEQNHGTPSNQYGVSQTCPTASTGPAESSTIPDCPRPRREDEF
ncbi:unnamed protein product, partial [Mesorhabditis spiculigera]